VGSWLQPVEAALDAAPSAVPVFFRDDDAGWGDGRLLALLDVFAAHDLPVDLAVIPGELDAGLARELCARRVGLHQHGLAHVNHEPEGRKCEFGPARDAAAQRRDIAEGRDRLAALLGDRVDPIFTPPWNRCTADTAHALADLGFTTMSREARAAPLGVPGLAELPVSVDWFAHDHGRRLSPAELGVRIGEALGARSAVGLMFHHAIMELADMDGASALLGLLAGHERARPALMMALAGSVVV
jgi:peptidoglycan/xylan/chitin deacetylase (PgdA/CDA1 family)